MQKFLASFFFCFGVALIGLVCKLAVGHQIRYTKRVDLPTEDVAVQVVSLVLGDVMYPSVVTQRKVWTPLSRKSSKMSFLNQARWSRRPLLVISAVVKNDFFLN